MGAVPASAPGAALGGLLPTPDIPVAYGCDPGDAVGFDSGVMVRADRLHDGVVLVENPPAFVGRVAGKAELFCERGADVMQRCPECRGVQHKVISIIDGGLRSE